MKSAPPIPVRSKAEARLTTLRWTRLIWGLALGVILAGMVRTDVSHARRVASLSLEGTPAPAHDASSITGYTLGQRHFLGTHERGETYRWIASTQEWIASDPTAPATSTADNLPVERPRLMPRLYAAWLAALSWGLHGITGESLPIAVERIALWEPVVTHALAFLAAAIFMGTRHGPAAAVVAGLFVALFPPLAGQFLPGVLTPRTWALLLASYALALSLPRNSRDARSRAISVRSALAAGLALWLDPSIGFPAVVIAAAFGAALIFKAWEKLPALTWSLVGAGTTIAAWIVDQAPWDLAAGELRYVHPTYALAWLGLGLVLDGLQSLRSGGRLRRWRIVEIATAVPLISALAAMQLTEGYRGWLYASAAMRRLTSLDETFAFSHAFAWLGKATLGEVLIASFPVACVLGTLAVWMRWRATADASAPFTVLIRALPLAGAMAFSVFAIRWGVIASLLAVPTAWLLAAQTPVAWRRSLAVAAGAFLVALFAGARSLPMSLQRTADATAPGPADVEALVFRQFSHWLASHSPGQRVLALAPPGLSDSLVFHGGCRVLMSTAWESYPGQVAASRILSAPEASEAEAVLESRGVTHIVLPTWDRVLPLLVKEPIEEGKTTLHARLKTWVLPPYLRPLPYQLPPAPGYAGETMPVFKVVPTQDDALALSRLAEYFVEMKRQEPAQLAAKALAEAFSDDPDAATARAFVHAQLKNKDHFERELDRLAADCAAGRSPSAWDRRVQRAIVLALGRRSDHARAEIEACLAEATLDSVLELTPLQAFRLTTLASGFGLALPDVAIAERLAALSSEYRTNKTSVSAR